MDNSEIYPDYATFRLVQKKQQQVYVYWGLVKELLRLTYGDKGRLEDIKRRLERQDLKILYNSDINYLVKLYQIHPDITPATIKQGKTKCAINK